MAESEWQSFCIREGRAHGHKLEALCAAEVARRHSTHLASEDSRIKEKSIWKHDGRALSKKPSCSPASTACSSRPIQYLTALAALDADVDNGGKKYWLLLWQVTIPREYDKVQEHVNNRNKPLALQQWSNSLHDVRCFVPFLQNRSNIRRTFVVKLRID